MIVSRARLTTSDIPEATAEDMVSLWSSRHLYRLAIRPVENVPLELTSDLMVFPDFTCALGDNSPIAARVSPEVGHEDDVYLSCVLAGGGEVSGRNWEYENKPGDGLFHWSDDGFHVHQPQRSRVINMRLSIDAIRRRVDFGNGPPLRRVTAGHPAMALLRNYVATLQAADLSHVTPTFAEATSSHLHDLAGLALGANRDGAHNAATSGLPAVRLALAKELVARHLDNPRLNEDFLSRHMGLSRSYIRKLFANDGHAVAAYIRRERLLKARRFLLAPTAMRIKILDIASMHGFDDVSTFNRAFRRMFDMSPSEARDQVKGED